MQVAAGAVDVERWDSWFESLMHWYTDPFRQPLISELWWMLEWTGSALQGQMVWRMSVWQVVDAGRKDFEANK